MSQPQWRIQQCPANDQELEAVAALGWRASETEPLGGWLLRAAGGFTGRANSALALADPGRPLAEAVDHVAAWYRDRGLPARFMVPMPLAAGLDEQLARRGWVSTNAVRVLVSPLAPLLDGWSHRRPVTGPPGDLVFTVDAGADDAWVAAYHYRGGVLPPQARDVLGRGDTLGFASVRDGAGAVLAIARGSVDRDRSGIGWLGVTAVEVDPSARRRGLGGRILHEVAEWGQARGASWCHLQVAVENEPALALYQRAGFLDHHRYHYRDLVS
jgi:N-acetylglutamate synthase